MACGRYQRTINSNRNTPYIADCLPEVRHRAFFRHYGLGKRTGSSERYPGDRSPWATIGGAIKYWRFSWDYVVWGISFQNLMMLNETVPVYDSKSGKGGRDKTMSFFELGMKMSGRSN